MPWPQTGATHYHAQIELQDKGRAINGLVFCYSWDLEPLDLRWDSRQRSCNQRVGRLLQLVSIAFGPSKRSGPRLLSTVP